MLVPFSSVSEAQDFANRLALHEQELVDQISSIQAELDAVKLLRESTLGWIAAKRVPVSNSDSPQITVDDIRHCRTQREILREVALRSGGYARLSDVATLVMAAGKAKGKRDSVRSSLHNWVKADDRWAYHEPGVYRLLETIPPSSEADASALAYSRKPDSEDEEEDSSSQADCEDSLGSLGIAA